MGKPTLRHAARKILERGRSIRGGCYWSRIGKDDVYVGWDGEGQSVNLAIRPADAIALRDWLIEQFPVIDQHAAAGLKSELLELLDNYAPPDSSFETGYPEIPVEFWTGVRSIYDRRVASLP